MNQAKLTINFLTNTFGSIIGFAILILPQSAIAATLGFENDFNDWNTSGTTITNNSFGGITPTEGSRQAFLSTGGANPSPVFELVLESLFPLPTFGVGSSLEGQNQGQGFLFSGSQITNLGNTLSPTTPYTQGSAIKTTITVNTGDTLKFNYNFLTNENSSNSPFGNDFAFFSLNEEIIHFVDVTSTSVDSATSFLKETSYQEFSYQFSSTGELILGFGIVGDSISDSGLLLDNIRLESATTAVPEPSSILGLLASVGLGTIFRKKKLS